jgi:hypothetical protein
LSSWAGMMNWKLLPLVEHQLANFDIIYYPLAMGPILKFKTCTLTG